jgi:Glycosyl hydrolases family 16
MSAIARNRWRGLAAVALLLGGCSVTSDDSAAGADGGAPDGGGSTTSPDGGGGVADAAPAPRDASHDGAPAPATDAAPDVDARPPCTTGVPDPTHAPQAIDVACFTSTFDDGFVDYDVSSGPVADGLHPVERWFNGTEQCCMSPSGGLKGVNYPTPGASGPVNPYSLLPGGGLQIRAQHIGDTWFSGVMTSVDQDGKGFAQKYGYFEWNAKLAPGTGTWPGFWMLPLPVHAQGGEIDILEQYGQNPPLDPATATRFIMTVHDWTNAQPGTQFVATGLPDLTAAFHRVGLLWNATYMALYFDGKLQWSTPTLDVMKRPYYLLADMGVGSGWDTSQTPSPSDLQIKWIRAYSVPGF